MRLSASYNFFNGHEHLIASLISIRKQVDHISLVYQTLSNSGEQISKEDLDILKEVSSKGLVDEMFRYEPNLKLTRRRNELSKRKIGLMLAKKANCTHFFTIDADEFYRGDELKYAKTIIEKENLNSTSVCSFMHVRRPVYRAFDTTNVPFITKINFTTGLGVGTYPVRQVDSTRRIFIWPRRHRHFSPDQIAMYHMNLVRKEFSSKFNNTSTTDESFLASVRNELAQWEYGKPFNFGKKGLFHCNEVPNEFFTWDPAFDPSFDRQKIK